MLNPSYKRVAIATRTCNCCFRSLKYKVYLPELFQDQNVVFILTSLNLPSCHVSDNQYRWRKLEKKFNQAHYILGFVTKSCQQIAFLTTEERCSFLRDSQIETQKNVRHTWPAQTSTLPFPLKPCILSSKLTPAPAWPLTLTVYPGSRGSVQLIGNLQLQPAWGGGGGHSPAPSLASTPTFLKSIPVVTE